MHILNKLSLTFSTSSITPRAYTSQSGVQNLDVSRFLNCEQKFLTIIINLMNTLT